jgi:transcriptional regulator with XRE-family HTH domain
MAGATFGSLVKRQRKTLDLTQEELADRLGSAVETVRKIENGTRRPSKHLAEQLADELHIPTLDKEAFFHQARTLTLSENNTARHSGVQIFNTIPVPLTPLLGRDREVEEVLALLGQPSVRLVTLLGLPGVGKTRLALEVMRRLASDPGVHVSFVRLDLVTQPRDVMPVIAQALGVTETEPDSLSKNLHTHFNPERTLLLLDTFEHLLIAALSVAQLLEGSTGLKVLTTSRTPLRLEGEHEYIVHPLLFPDAHASPHYEDFSTYGAVRMFIERAQEVKADFSLNSDNAKVIAEICEQLDGLPLALELAAAWLRVMTPEHLLTELQQDLHLLTSPCQSLPERQRSLAATLAYSWRLLLPKEQAGLANLSVFQGGFTEAAAIAVAGTSIGILASLVGQSLLEFDSHGRYGFHRLIHRFVNDKLALNPRRKIRAQTEHSTYYLRLVRESDERTDVEPAEAFAILREEAENIQAAWCWALQNGPPEVVAALAAPVRRYVATQG